MEKSIPSNLHAEMIAIPDIGYATLQGLTIIIFFGGNDLSSVYSKPLDTYQAIVSIAIYRNEGALTTGPAGVGKSEILRALRALLESKGEKVITCSHETYRWLDNCSSDAPKRKINKYVVPCGRSRLTSSVYTRCNVSLESIGR